MRGTVDVAVPAARGRSWGVARRSAGVALSAVAVVFLGVDALGKLLRVAPVVAGTMELGYPADVVRPLGAILLACVAAYAVPRVSILGAVLLTGYLGGAVATHVRVGSPLLTHALFPVYVAVCVWAGLWLRDTRIPNLFAPRA